MPSLKSILTKQKTSIDSMIILHFYKIFMRILLTFVSINGLVLLVTGTRTLNRQGRLFFYFNEDERSGGFFDTISTSGVSFG